MGYLIFLKLTWSIMVLNPLYICIVHSMYSRINWDIVPTLLTLYNFHAFTKGCNYRSKICVCNLLKSDVVYKEKKRQTDKSKDENMDFDNSFIDSKARSSFE